MNSNLDPNGDFLVKESRIVNYVIGVVCLIVFFVSMMFGDFGWSNFLVGMGMFLIPGGFALARARRNAVVIRINRAGFYFAGKLVTDWFSFYDAVLRDQSGAGAYKDNFVIDLRYYSADRSLIYTSTIPLGNTQDRSEEEVLAAIQFYYDLSRSASGVGDAFGQL